MKRIIIFFIIGLTGIMLLSSCFVDFNSGKRPIDYANTRWVAKNPDIYFEVGTSKEVTYAQITIDDNVIELLCEFDIEGYINFYDISAYIPADNNFPSGRLDMDKLLFCGGCKFYKNKLAVKISNNKKGFLDDSIKEIIFVREDM